MEKYAKFNTRNGVLPMDFIMRKFNGGFISQEDEQNVKIEPVRQDKNDISQLIQSVLDDSTAVSRSQIEEQQKQMHLSQTKGLNQSNGYRSDNITQSQLSFSRVTFPKRISASQSILELQGHNQIDEEVSNHLDDI